IRGLGLHDVLTSWPFLLLALLLALNVAGLLVRHWGDRAARSLAAGGPFVDLAQARVNDSLLAVRERLPTALSGARARHHVDGDVVVARTGLQREGAILLVAGVALLLGALVVHRAAALDARVELDAGAAGADAANLRGA